jgi:hypothetical protein
MDRQIVEPILAPFQEVHVVRNNVFIAGEDDMESYIVRIYHRDRKDTKKMAGVVEEIGGEGKKGFLGPDSLWKILATPRREPEPDRKTLRSSSRGRIPLDERRDAMTFTEILRELNHEEE